MLRVFQNNTGLLQYRQGGAFVGIVLAPHPERTTPEEELQIPSPLILLPQLQSPGNHLRV
jgi:hypothetical protein